MRAAVTADAGDPRRAFTAVRCGLAVVAVLALYSGAAQWAETARNGPKPLYWVLLLVAGGVFLLVAEPTRPSGALRSPVLAWALAYVSMCVAWAVVRPTLSPDTDQALADRLRSVASIVGLMIAFDDERASRLARRAVVLVAVAASLGYVAEEIGVLSWRDGLPRFPGRASGFHVNPNEAGLTVVFGLAAGFSAVPRALRVPALVVCAAGVFATFSRGALVCYSVLLLVLLARREIGAGSAAVAAALVGAAVLSDRGVIETIMGASGTLNTDTLRRLTMTADDSGRAHLAGAAWARFVESPWFGSGLAVRESRTAHNMYLAHAAEHGVLGFLVFPALAIALAVRNGPGVPLAAVFVAAGVFNHNLLQLFPALVCIALAAVRPVEAPT